MLLKQLLPTSQRSLKLPSSDILAAIQERADALWVSASSDIFKQDVLKHKYDPECDCTWCKLTTRYIVGRKLAAKTRRMFGLKGLEMGEDFEEAEYLFWLDEDVCDMKAARRKMKTI